MAPAHAKDRGILGFGAILNNDIFGDGEDRWRTGSYSSSYVRGRPWEGQLPTRPGAVMEYRFHGEVIAPERISHQVNDDRPLVGVLSLGAHTHFQARGFEINGGVDLVLTGPATGLGNVQQGLHAATGGPRNRILGTQLPNRLFPTANVEVAREIRFGDTALALRPFGELQVGVETFARAGIDVTLGFMNHGGLLVRDRVSGQRYPTIVARNNNGLSFVVGGDIAYVHHSAYLPEDMGYDLTPTRKRLRAGIAYESSAGGMETAMLFVGLTYLGPEFERQAEGQTVAAISLNFRF